MALFGLSPLFLCFLASTFFTDPSTGLDVPRFLKLLALTSGVIHLLGAFNMRLCKPQCIAPSTPGSASTSDGERSIDEREPLLPSKPHRSDSQIIPVGEGRSVIELFKDSHFWLLALVALIILGSVSRRLATRYHFHNWSSAVRNDHFEYWDHRSFSQLGPHF
jgi:hypothetical protein